MTKEKFYSGEVSERLKEHAWKVCKRLIPASRVRIPPSPPVWFESVKAGVEPATVRQAPVLWWSRWFSRDDSLQTPPGPEGSNGSERFGCRDVAGGTATLFVVPFSEERTLEARVDGVAHSDDSAEPERSLDVAFP